MRKISMFMILIFAASVIAAAAADKPSLGVLRFTNNTSAGWWSGSTGRDLQDMLASELASTKEFSVLERKELDAVLKEQDLGASGRIDSSTKAQIGKIKGAKYLVAGTVTSYEEDVSGGGGGVSLFGVSVGGAKEKAYIAVDLKVIDTTTAEIVDARTVEGRSSSGGLSLGLSKGFFSGSLGGYEKTPAGKAIRACIIEITDYLTCSLVDKDSCMEEYDAKEKKRREGTKSSISLD